MAYGELIYISMFLTQAVSGQLYPREKSSRREFDRRVGEHKNRSGRYGEV
jgi:hypothetical protein